MRNQSPAQFSDFPVFTDTLTKPVYSLISSIRCLSTGISASCVGLLDKTTAGTPVLTCAIYTHTHHVSVLIGCCFTDTQTDYTRILLPIMLFSCHVLYLSLHTAGSAGSLSVLYMVMCL